MNITLIEKKDKQWDILFGMNPVPVGEFLVYLGKIVFFPANSTMWSEETLEAILTKARELQQTI